MLQLLTDAGVTSESLRNHSAKILEYHAVEDVDSFISIEDLKEIRYRGNSLKPGVINKLWALKVAQARYCQCVLHLLPRVVLRRASVL